MKIMKRCLGLLLAIVTILSAAGCSAGKKNTVVVGAKNYTESLLTGEVIAKLLESKTDLRVQRKFNLAPAICFESAQNGQIDLFPEYTGCMLIHYLEMDPIRDSEETYRVVKDECKKRYDLVWLDKLGFSNTYANAVRKDFAEKHQIKTNSDLTPLTPQLVYGAEHGYLDREDGYHPMCELYGYNFKQTLQMDIGLIYQSLSQGDMDVANVYTTDGLLYEYDLVVLEDDQHFFPNYDCAPVIRSDTLEKHPEIAEVLSVLKDCVTEQDMVKYNYLIDGKKMDVEKVADLFIKDHGWV